MATQDRPRDREGRGIALEVAIDVDGGSLPGDLTLVTAAKGLVTFAHGSGSSRRSSRNRFVASELQRAGFATLLFDLLTEDEERVDEVTGSLRFDIDHLARRLIAAIDWIGRRPELRALPLGLFGASTGAAAAVVAAAARPERVAAVVSRGGRPDLAADRLEAVEAPTLLVVGGADPQVLELNRAALMRLRSEKQLVVVPGASHLFEEPRTLEEVARLAREWFGAFLPGRLPAQSRAEGPGRAAP